MELELEITHLFEQVAIPEDELERLLKVVSWQNQPYFPFPGRTAWHFFEKPVYLKNDPEKNIPRSQAKGGWCLESGKIPAVFRRS